MDYFMDYMEESYDAEFETSDRLLSAADKRSMEQQIRDTPVVSDRTPTIKDVEIARIRTTTINTVQDFDDQSQYNALYREAQMLKQMQPVLQNGADVETFHGWDKANQIGHYSPHNYVRGYADVYHSYYTDIGGEHVALEIQPDGRYEIINGCHRVVAARDAGLSYIPARVAGHS